MNQFSYIDKSWYLDSKKELKKSLQERHLTFEQAQVILEDLTSDLNAELKRRTI